MTARPRPPRSRDLTAATEHFAGFDADQFPGLPTMSWLRANTNLRFCAFYLAPAPTHADAGWMPHRAALADLGWGFAPVYVGRQVRGPGADLDRVHAAQGTLDGAQAAELARSAGFPAGARAFLDLENGAPLPFELADYVEAWCAAFAGAGFSPGVYCSHALSARLAALVPAAARWVFRVATTAPSVERALLLPEIDPATVGAPGALICQHRDAVTLALPPGAPTNRLLVDLDCASVADPSAVEPDSGLTALEPSQETSPR